jgi:hypothetical protein
MDKAITERRNCDVAIVSVRKRRWWRRSSRHHPSRRCQDAPHDSGSAWPRRVGKVYWSCPGAWAHSTRGGRVWPVCWRCTQSNVEYVFDLDYCPYFALFNPSSKLHLLTFKPLKTPPLCSTKTVSLGGFVFFGTYETARLHFLPKFEDLSDRDAASKASTVKR